MISVKVEAGFGSTMLTASPSWTDISSYFRFGNTVRGRPSVDQRFETGTASIRLRNSDGRFTRNNSSSPYSPNVKLGTPIRITATIDGDATVIPLFYGEARGWLPEYFPGAEYAELTVPIADGFYMLNQEDLAGRSYELQRTDERIEAVLDDSGWPEGLRDLDVGLAKVQPTSFALPNDGGEQSALAHLLDVTEAEAGVLYMGRDGKVVFRNRVSLASATSVATYDGTDDYTDIAPKDDDDVYYNVIRIAREDGAQVEYDGSGSDPRRVLTRDVMPMATDSDALNVAQWLYGLFGENRQRIDGLRFKPRRDADLLSEIIRLDLRDVITVQFDPPGAGDTFNEECVVEHIRHEFAAKDWTTVLAVAPVSAVEAGPFFQLDVSQLDGDHYLA